MNKEYKISEYIVAFIDILGASEKIKQNSRRYAKRQLTWFKNNDKIVKVKKR